MESMQQTTMCLGHVCIRYRHTSATSSASHLVTVLSIIAWPFISVWLLVVIILLIYESMRPQRVSHACRADIAKHHDLVEERCPLTITKCQTGTCAVCLDEIAKEQVCRRLPCTHVFHARCFDGWAIRADTPMCPLCKREVVRLESV